MKISRLALLLPLFAWSAHAAAPVAVDDDYPLDPVGETRTLDVMDNDTDADLDALIITEVSQGQYGSVTTDGFSAFYTAQPGFPGTDTFTYRISDQTGSPTATAPVTVRGTPIPLGGSMVIRQGAVAPGTTRTILSLGIPAVNRSGEVAFTAPVVPATIFSGYRYPAINGAGAVLLTTRSPVPPDKVPAPAKLIYDTTTGGIATVGDAAPGVNGGSYSAFGKPIGNDGGIAFSATLKASAQAVPRIAASNDVGLWQRVGGPLTLVAREGAQVDHGGTLSPYMRSFTTLALGDEPGTGAIFRGVLGNPPLAAIANRVTAKNDEVIYAADANGKPTLLIREGRPLSFLPQLGPVLDFRALGDSIASRAVARSHAGPRFAAWVKTLPPGDTFPGEAIVILPLR